jgi:hypothetical protein
VPAAAVIPAPIAYIKVVAVKKLVVGSMTKSCGLFFREHCIDWSFYSVFLCCSLLSDSGCWNFYLEKIEVLKAGVCLNIAAWDNRIGLRFYFVGFRNTK